jgi:hypothetical protein
MSEIVSTQIKLTDSELKGISFNPKFYDFIGERLLADINNPNIRYDCTKINIADNVQRQFYHGMNKEESASLTMVLCMAGPKVDYALKDNIIEVFDGFITYTESGEDTVTPEVYDSLTQLLEVNPDQGCMGCMYGFDEGLNENPELEKAFMINGEDFTVHPRIQNIEDDTEKNEIRFSVCYEHPTDYETILEEHKYAIRLVKLN